MISNKTINIKTAPASPPDKNKDNMSVCARESVSVEHCNKTEDKARLQETKTNQGQEEHDKQENSSNKEEYKERDQLFHNKSGGVVNDKTGVVETEVPDRRNSDAAPTETRSTDCKSIIITTSEPPWVNE